MPDEVVKNCQQKGADQPGNLREAVDTLKARFSSVRVETLVANGDTSLSVRFLGDGVNLEERQLLVTSLAQCLPPALSILGIGAERKHCDEDEAHSNNAA